MQKRTKRILAYVAVGVVGALAVYHYVKMYQERDSAIATRDFALKKLTIEKKRNVEAASIPDSLLQAGHVADSLAIVTDSLSNVVTERDEEISHLRNALETANKNLSDCRGHRKQTVAKKAVKSKPAVRATDNGCKQNKPSVQVSKKNADVSTNITVEQDKCSDKQDANITIVVIDNGSNNNTVNVNNTTINNYNVVADTVKVAEKTIKFARGKCYTGRVVRCK